MKDERDYYLTSRFGRTHRYYRLLLLTQPRFRASLRMLLTASSDDFRGDERRGQVGSTGFYVIRNHSDIGTIFAYPRLGYCLNGYRVSTRSSRRLLRDCTFAVQVGPTMITRSVNMYLLYNKKVQVFQF